MMENTVEYKVYFSNYIVPGDTKTEDTLEEYLAKFVVYLSPIIGGYIWQNQPFALQLDTSIDSEVTDETPVCLHGCTDFGDNVEDEWFIVYLLLELTKRFPEIAVSVCDSDGEFLLIEAAHFIPRWLSPETSRNRMFLQGGHVHIVPIPQTPAEVTVYPTGVPLVTEALRLVFGPVNTLSGPSVHQAISKRIQGYPDHTTQSKHHAHCYVPAAVKFVLDQQPSLISAVVRAFCERDPLDMKLCRRMKHFTPDTCVMTRVQFTRCLYAQLVQQDFRPEKQSTWNLPSKTNPQHKAYELGMKLAYGCEILCARSSGETSKEDSQPRGAKWDRFLGCLERNGYFKGELEGSKLYTELMERAKYDFHNSFTHNDRKNSGPGDVMLSLLRDANIDVDKMKEDSTELLAEDDDKWLEISPEELDGMLSRYSTKGQPDQSTADISFQNGVHDKEEFDLEQVTHSMKSFVDNLSSHEGAEFPWSVDNEDVQFNADSFADTVQKLLDESSNRDNDDVDDSMNLSDDDILDDEDESWEIKDEAEEKEMRTYMNQMDRELSQTTLGKSFEKEPNQAADGAGASPLPPSKGNSDKMKPLDFEETNEDEDDSRPVDVDLNLVKNILESFSLQQGLAGPASNILNAMGVSLPEDSSES